MDDFEGMSRYPDGWIGHDPTDNCNNGIGLKKPETCIGHDKHTDG